MHKTMCSVFGNTDIAAASLRLSAMARRSVLSRSKTPYVACSTESRRQSPAVRFHSGYRRPARRSVNSTLQFMTASSSSSSARPHNRSQLRQGHCRSFVTYSHSKLQCKRGAKMLHVHVPELNIFLASRPMLIYTYTGLLTFGNKHS